MGFQWFFNGSFMTLNIVWQFLICFISMQSLDVCHFCQDYTFLNCGEILKYWYYQYFFTYIESAFSKYCNFNKTWKFTIIYINSEYMILLYASKCHRVVLACLLCSHGSSACDNQKLTMFEWLFLPINWWPSCNKWFDRKQHAM